MLQDRWVGHRVAGAKQLAALKPPPAVKLDGGPAEVGRREARRRPAGKPVEGLAEVLRREARRRPVGNRVRVGKPVGGPAEVLRREARRRPAVKPAPAVNGQYLSAHCLMGSV